MTVRKRVVRHLRLIVSLVALCCCVFTACRLDTGPARLTPPWAHRDPTRSLLLDEYSVYQAPSAPIPIQRVLAEWQPAAALLLALPHASAVEHALLFSYMMDLTEHAIRVVDVVLLLDERALSSFLSVLEELERRGLTPFLSGDRERRITLLPGRVDSIWIRDYGPFFALGPDGEVVLIDSMYDDLRSGEPRGRSVLDFDLDPYARGALARFLEQAPVGEYPPPSPQDDSVVSYVADYLARMHGKPARISRAPLLIPGGDLFTDGSGGFFTSFETLLLNGARRARVEGVLESYYGMKSLTYLEPLPGATIKHLDMIFRPVGNQHLLLAEYPPETSTDDIYMRYLHDEARRVLARNERVLLEALPNRELVRMPMPIVTRHSRIPERALERTLGWFDSQGAVVPGVLLESPELWNLERFAQFVHALDALETESTDAHALRGLLGLSGASPDLGQGEAGRRLVEALVGDEASLAKWMVTSVDLDSGPDGSVEGAISRARARIVAEQLDPAIHDDPDGHDYLYRSYLNATLLEGAAGRMLLVPRYAGYEDLEPGVAARYRELYPDAEIVFVSSDAVIQQYGAIHCTTLVLPELGFSAASSRTPGRMR